ncbi:hypothetical protein OGAPHI_005070 [Ogataea philodendri]|uniref:Uncharacterized protein n=1 Tax=Ogataea philodendri TaxID=1378263 RepID=A0A9P8P237_9ASCO|nr:uncharacterized protein OGAPHI_005070 [Ogataea philodendri]KAH3663669.1 hypothetical protein OGAPHI_005070 [Ogataea philodendri]
MYRISKIDEQVNAKNAQTANWMYKVPKINEHSSEIMESEPSMRLMVAIDQKEMHDMVDGVFVVPICLIKSQIWALMSAIPKSSTFFTLFCWTSSRGPADCGMLIERPQSGDQICRTEVHVGYEFAHGASSQFLLDCSKVHIVQTGLIDDALQQNLRLVEIAVVLQVEVGQPVNARKFPRRCDGDKIACLLVVDTVQFDRVTVLFVVIAYSDV